MADVVAKVVDGNTPWPLFLALVLLVGVGAFARRVLGSVGRLGSRIGVLESALQLEITRRRQVEEELADLGVRLPYWPPDGSGPRPRDRVRDLERETDDLDAPLPDYRDGAEPTVFRPAVPAPPTSRR